MFAIVAKLAGAFIVPGWTSILVVVSFLGGIQLTLMGMLGLYVGRIYEEVKARPLYILREDDVPDRQSVPGFVPDQSSLPAG